MEQQTAKLPATETLFDNRQFPVKHSELIFQNMSDGIVLLDQQGNITYMNAAAMNILGVKESELSANVSFIEQFAQNKKNKKFNKFSKKSIEHKEAGKRSDAKYITPDKKTHYLDISISLIQSNPQSQETSYINEKPTAHYFADDSNKLPEHYSADDKSKLTAHYPADDKNKLTSHYLTDDSNNMTSQYSSEIQGMLLLIQDTSYRHRLKQHEHDCAYIFAGLIFCITLYLTLWRYLSFTRHIYLHRDTYTLIIEIITFALFLEIVFMTSFSLSEIGLIPKWKNFKRNCLETLATGIITCLIILLTKIILTLIGYKIKGYFIGGSFNGAYKYIFTSFVQEFLARGVIQTSVKYLMHVKYQTAFSIILTSLLFSLMHMPFGFYFMFGAFILSLALGYLYEHQQSIWGCVFLHWGCGYLAMCLFF